MASGGEIRADALLLERLLSLRGPGRHSPLSLVASELIGHPEQCDVVSTLRPLSALHFAWRRRKPLITLQSTIPVLSTCGSAYALMSDIQADVTVFRKPTLLGEQRKAEFGMKPLSEEPQQSGGFDSAARPCKQFRLSA